MLKLDIEGAEREALEGFDALTKVGCMVGELHVDALGLSPEAFYSAVLPGLAVTTHLPEPHRCTFTAVRR